MGGDEAGSWAGAHVTDSAVCLAQGSGLAVKEPTPVSLTEAFPGVTRASLSSHSYLCLGQVLLPSPAAVLLGPHPIFW